jgi:flagellar FliL protein
MASPSPAPAADASSGGLKSQLPLIIALVAGLAVGGGAGAFVVGPVLASGIAPAGPEVAAHVKKARHAAQADDEASADEGDESADDEESSGDEESGGGHGEKGGAEKPVYTIDNLVLNPAESGGTRFLLLSVTFELKNAAVLEQMKTRDAELRDAVLVTLGKRTVDQLADMTQRDSIKVQLTKAAGTLFKKGAVKRIYFPQFVIQ